ncbi:MAG: SpoIIIAH-like family protein [Oscillospiraceae bacterium]|nr:SpoIIIAH-like family protein [Oscillospiraceae bacterium]
MKLNMILGKKQIVLASLVFILSIAVYLNWQFAKDGEGFPVTGSLSDEKDTKELGDAKFVNNGEDKDSKKDENSKMEKSAKEYFAKARMERDKARDKSKETMSNMIKDEKLSSDDKEKLQVKESNMVQITEKETKMENLIKAKGFLECMTYLEEGKVSVIVHTEGLAKEQASQIKDIVVSQGKILPENITITEVK